MPGAGLVIFGRIAWVNKGPALKKAKQRAWLFLLAPTEWTV